MNRCLVWAMLAVVTCWGTTLVETGRADLVGWWTFDENVLDHSEMGNDGELFGAVYDNRVPPVIGAGQSLSFEDDADHVFIEADPSLDSDVFTISMFIYDRGQVGAFERFTSRERDTFETAINVFKPFDGLGEISYYPGEGGWTWGTHIPPLEEWQHLAYISDGEEIRVYADGELIIGPDPILLAPSGFMHIGNRWNDVEGFDGLMDDVAIWNEALPESFILELASGSHRPDTVPTVPEPATGGMVWIGLLCLAIWRSRR